MTRERAFALYRQRVEEGRFTLAEMALNDPITWPMWERDLTPAELRYASKALRDALGIIREWV